MSLKNRKCTVIKNIDVRFSELDPLNVVWHGNYLKYFEDARELFCNKYDLNYFSFVQNQYTSFITKCEIEYKRALRYGDRVRVEVTLEDSKTCKLVFRYRIFDLKKQIICTGRTEQVVVNKYNELMIEWPEFLKKWKESIYNNEDNKYQSR